MCVKGYIVNYGTFESPNFKIWDGYNWINYTKKDCRRIFKEICSEKPHHKTDSNQ